MSTAQIRETLRSYLNQADEKFLKAVYALMEYDQTKEPFELTTTQKKILDQRKLNHENGKSKSYTWKEVKLHAKAALSK